ncbi:MAG: GC-type dockerin domain-anchored protein [Planctomycetota bacterium]
MRPVPHPLLRLVMRLDRTTAALAVLAASSAHGQVEVREIDPTDTDPAITPLVAPSGLEALHVAALDPALRPAERPGLLFVFLPGSGGVPTQYAEVVAHAAGEGWHALGVAYGSWPSVRDLTRDSSDPDLPEAIRRERLFGEPRTDVIDVPPPDAIDNRLARALAFLEAAHPGEGWGRFLDAGGEPTWRTIVVAGHSQGAGHAAYLTRDFSMGGAIMFAGPGDFVPGVGPAPWLFRGGNTPAERMLAFTHVNDPTAAGFFGNQRILGLEAFGGIESVDRRAAHELSSHMLTSLRDPGHRNFHSAVVVDEFLPTGATGENLYEPVWTYLLATQAEASRGCRADLDADGALSLFDFLAFQNAFATGDPTADFDGNGVLTLFDFLAFQNTFAAGCA